MKKLSLIAGVLALVIATALPIANVSANTATYNGSSSFTLNREVSGVTNNVNNTYTYTIAQDSAPTGATVTGMPSSATVVFNNVAPVSGTATANTVVDLTNVDFSMIGNYVYTVTESATSDTTNYPIDSTHNSYKIHISVRYQVDSNTGVPNNNVYVATIQATNNADAKASTIIWTNGASRTYIEIDTTTTGNSAETDKCFAYTVDIPVGNGVSAGDTYTIESSTTCTGGAASVTAGSPATIYLKHGDTALVGQNSGTNELPVGASYTITKTDTSDGYTTTIDGTETRTTSGTTTTSSNVQPIEIVNDKDEDAFTGIFTNMWLYLLLLIIGILGLIYVNRRSTEKE